MLFNSFTFMLCFFPLVWLITHRLGAAGRIRALKGFLVLASFVFYAWFNVPHLFLLVASILVNHRIAGAIESRGGGRRLLTVGIAFNVLLLVVFKYSAWLASLVSDVFGLGISVPAMAFPLGISFYTFTQIAFLTDVHRGRATREGLLDYALFVGFFPKLLQGPICRAGDLMPRIVDERADWTPNARNVALGLLLFSIGIFKKVMLADSLAPTVSDVFDLASKLDFVEAWLGVLSYTFQIYLDFSGYVDMAMGCALMLNFEIPQNFFSPYRSGNIQDFWRRWHATLGHFLRDYIYIPLGGSRGGGLATTRNLVVTFAIAGLWHGAGGNFILWGLLHGAALSVHRAWKKTGVRLPAALGWAVTFLFVNLSWIFFRATTWKDAVKVLRACLGFEGATLPPELARHVGFLSHLGVKFGAFLADVNLHRRAFFELLGYLAVSALVSFAWRNTDEIRERFQGGWAGCVAAALLMVCSVLSLQRATGFLYFSF